jgi:hypothetical protein
MSIEAFGQEFESVKDLVRSKTGLFLGTVAVEAGIGYTALATGSETTMWASHGTGLTAIAIGAWATLSRK